MRKLLNKLFICLVLLSHEVSVISFSILKSQAEQQEDAKKWADKYLSDASGSDLQMVANLLYWSYKRSEINLRVQSFASENLETMFKCWQNIAATRLNPSKSSPNSLRAGDIKKSNELFLESYVQYKNICESYASCVETVVKKSVFETNL